MVQQAPEYGGRPKLGEIIPDSLYDLKRSLGFSDIPVAPTGQMAAQTDADARAAERYANIRKFREREAAGEDLGLMAQLGLGGAAMASPRMQAQQMQDRIQAQQQTAAAAKDQQKARLEQALGVESKTTIKKKPTGETEVSEEFKTDQGTMKITRQENKYQQQYEDLLQQGVQQQQALNLQPIAMFVDQLTGSRMAPQMQDATAAQQQQLAQRIRYSKALRDAAEEPAMKEYQRRIQAQKMKLREREVAAKEGQAAAAMKKAMKDKKGKDKIYMEFANKFRRQEEDVIIDDETRTKMRQSKQKISEYTKERGIPPVFNQYLEDYATAGSAEEVGNIFNNVESIIAKQMQKKGNLSNEEVLQRWEEVQNMRRDIFSRLRR